MNNELIRLIIEIVAFAGLAVLCYFMPKIASKSMDKNAVLTYVASWAYKFVVAAKNQMLGSTGKEKYDYVANEVKKVCETQGITFNEELIKALIEEAYDKMKQREKE